MAGTRCRAGDGHRHSRPPKFIRPAPCRASRNPTYRRQRHHYDRGNGRIRGRNVDRHLSIHQTMAAHSKNTSAAPAINIPLRVRHLGGSAGTSLNRWACSVAIFSRAAAVSRGVHPFASEAVTKAANATSKATSQLTSRSGLPFGNMGGCTAWDMHTKRFADERFPRFEPFTFEGRRAVRIPRQCSISSSASWSTGRCET